MTNIETRRQDAITSFARVIRGFAEASLVAFGFAFAILLIGIPVALIVRTLHEGLSWVARLHGDLSAPLGALVGVSTVAAGAVLIIVFVKLLVPFPDWRPRFRGGVVDKQIDDTRLDLHGSAGTAWTDAELLRVLQDRSRLFYERFPGGSGGMETAGLLRSTRFRRDRARRTAGTSAVQ
jgi:hypothetical protein